MPVWGKAWEQTGFVERSRFLYTLGFGALTLLINYEFGLRPWQLTLWFFASLVAAYALFTVIEFFWHATWLGVRIQWNVFTERVAKETSEALVRLLADNVKSPTKPKFRTLNGQQKSELVRMLKTRAGKIQILSPAGDPEAFKFGLQFRAAFAEAGWEVTQSLSNFSYVFSGLSILVRGKPNRDVSAVSHVLLGADIAYELRSIDVEMTSIEHDQCTLYIGNIDN